MELSPIQQQWRRLSTLHCAVWYHEYETDYRRNHNMIDPSRVIESRPTLDALLQEILTSYHVKHGDEAYVWPNPSGDWGTSMIGWDNDGGLIPVVFLGSGMYDKLTVCHEAAHHVDKARKGLIGRTDGDTASSHNSDWLSLFIEILNRWLPSVAKELVPMLRKGS